MIGPKYWMTPMWVIELPILGTKILSLLPHWHCCLFPFGGICRSFPGGYKCYLSHLKLHLQLGANQYVSGSKTPQPLGTLVPAGFSKNFHKFSTNKRWSSQHLFRYKTPITYQIECVKQKIQVFLSSLPAGKALPKTIRPQRPHFETLASLLDKSNSFKTMLCSKAFRKTRPRVLGWMEGILHTGRSPTNG